MVEFFKLSPKAKEILPQNQYAAAFLLWMAAQFPNPLWRILSYSMVHQALTCRYGGVAGGAPPSLFHIYFVIRVYFYAALCLIFMQPEIQCK